MASKPLSPDKQNLAAQEAAELEDKLATGAEPELEDDEDDEDEDDEDDDD